MSEKCSRGTATAALLVSLAALLASGCVDRSVPYETIDPELDYSGRCSVAVAVVDMREQVLDGGRSPAVVGALRVAGSRMADLTTGDGSPLADAIGEAIAESLRRAGFEAPLVDSEPGEDRGELLERARELKPDYVWLLEIRDWWSSGRATTALSWELTLTAIDAYGAEIAETSAAGKTRWNEDGARESEGESSPETDPAATLHDQLVELLERSVSRLLNDPIVPRRMERFPDKVAPEGGGPPAASEPLEPAESFSED
ncbi:MAG: hypothetical protein R6V85_07235 [Polyangia bacterium]